MSTERLDGRLLARMLENGLNLLRLRETEINKLNVFPVADGDTGTNMRLTLENGLRAARPEGATGPYLCALSNGMLLGARGNSGVILSQLFKGLYQELARTTTLSAAEMRNGLIRGYRMAYAAVVRPVEGTLLTVAREGVENVRRQVGRKTPIETFLTMYLGEMRKSLAATPQMLDVLRDAGVVDSGAAGYIAIVEGMLKYLYGEIVTAAAAESPALGEPVPDTDAFTENSRFEDGYCLEFLLQLMRDPKYLQNFVISEFIDALGFFGNSLVAVQEHRRVKVHIHTREPEKIVSHARQYGEFVTFKLENMQLQHNSRLSPPAEAPKEKKKLAFVAAADGAGFRELLTSLGCDRVIDGGKTMNASADEFLRALESVNAEQIAILPNHGNTVSAARQAAALYRGEAKITVLESTDPVQAYCALAMDVPDEEDTDFRLSQLRDGLTGVRTLAVTEASRDWSGDGLSAKAGQAVVVESGKIVAAAETDEQALAQLLATLEDEPEAVLVFRGQNVTDRDERTLCAFLEETYQGKEISLLPGGQQVYRWLIGLL